MQVTPINQSTNTYKGTVHISVEKKVDDLINSRIKHEKVIAHKDSKPFGEQDKNKIKAIYINALNNLKNEMKLLDPNAELIYDNTPGINREGTFRIVNPQAYQNITIEEGVSIGKFNPEKSELYMQPGSYFDIDFHGIIGRLVDTMEFVNKSEINQWFAEHSK